MPRAAASMRWRVPSPRSLEISWVRASWSRTSPATPGRSAPPTSRGPRPTATRCC
ncbi:Uncharacterised protein [Bordetella pertussis]|nr:Uncharacterised protein [Bordetella pertussis]